MYFVSKYSKRRMSPGMKMRNMWRSAFYLCNERDFYQSTLPVFLQNSMQIEIHTACQKMVVVQMIISV